MDKKQLEKNKLDLEYHKYIQLLNGVFIFGTTGFLGFIGSFIWSKNFKTLLTGSIISMIILFVAYNLYIKINKKLEQISKGIQNIK